MLLRTRDIPPPDQPTNTFLALRPPWPIAERFHSDATQLCADARVFGSQRPFFILHMTLLPLGGAMGRLPHHLLRSIDRALGMVRFPAFEIVLDEAGSFETRKDSVPFVLEGRELMDVAALRFAAMGALHAQELHVLAPKSFRPHMTLAYARRRCPRMSVPPFRWKASEFQLIESWVGRTRYVELGRWTLWDDAPPRWDSSPRKRSWRAEPFLKCAGEMSI